MGISYVEQIKYRGFSAIPEIKAPSKELIEIASLIDLVANDNPKVDALGKKEVLDKSRTFLSKYFELHRVPFVKNIKGPFLDFELTGDIHPFGIPIKLVKDVDIFFAMSNEVLTLNAIDDNYLSYRSISLPKYLNELSPLAYTHELTHTQLNHTRGIVQNYINIEFLSIFLELVQALETSFDERLLIIHDGVRLGELQSVILEQEKNYNSKDPEMINVLVEGTTYLHSTLKAYQLFFMYYYGDLNIKRKIMLTIQNVFDHKMSVEELLQQFGITYENSEDKEQFRKYFKRG